MAKMPRVLVAGFYGAANLGDEMILSVVLKWVAEARSEPVVVSLNPAYTRTAFGVEAVDYFSLPEIADAASSVNAFVLGGGGLFQDQHCFDVPSLYRFPAATISQYAQLLFLAAQHGLPTVALAQGVGPLRNLQARDIAADVFTRATYVSVRDPASAALLREIGVDRDIPVAGDPGWCYEAQPATRTIAGQFPELRGKRVLVVVVREWTVAGDWEGQLAGALRGVLGKGDAIVWASFQRKVGNDIDVLTDDATIDRIVQAAGEDIVHARWPDATLDEVVQAIKDSTGVIAMRLHALLIAIRCRKPVIALEYDEKVRYLGETAGLSGAMRMPLEKIADSLPAALRALFDSPAVMPAAGVKRLIADAGAHRKVLFNALKNVKASAGRARWTSTGFDWIGGWRDQEIASRERTLRHVSAQLAAAVDEQDRLKTTLTATLDEVTSAKAALTATNAGLASSNDKLAAENVALTSEKAGLAEVNASLKAIHVELTKSNAELLKANAELTRARTALSTANAGLKTTLAELTTAHADLTTVNAELNSRNAELAAAIAAAREKEAVLAAIRAEFDRASVKLAQMTGRVDTLQAALDAQSNATRLAEDRYRGAIESRSWRITRPLRMIGDAARHVRRMIQRGPGSSGRTS